MIPIEDTNSLSLLYHLNSEPWLNMEAYQESTGEIEYRRLGPPGAALALPAPPDSALRQLLGARSSCRRYQQRAMPVTVLSTLLSAAYGLTRKTQLTDGTTYLCRSVPSAGGLFPLEVYLLIQSVTGVADGLHHYDICSHALEPMRTGLVMEDFREVLLALPFIQDANIVFFLAAVFARTQKKYGARGYRYILLEAGHSAQNICLTATQEGLGSLCVGGYRDGALNRMLGLDSTKEGVLYAVAAGYPQ